MSANDTIRKNERNFLRDHISHSFFEKMQQGDEFEELDTREIEDIIKEMDTKTLVMLHE